MVVMMVTMGVIMVVVMAMVVVVVVRQDTEHTDRLPNLRHAFADVHVGDPGRRVVPNRPRHNWQ
jgi:hypothetical protein